MSKSHYPIALDFRQVDLKIKDKAILQNINLQIPAGQTTVLLGPSGAGKSTLMHWLSAYLNHLAGT